MGFLQAYYTSCTHGLLGTSGFQYQAVSRGLDEQTLTRIARYGGYNLPRTFPLQPTHEDVAGAPLTLAYHRLPDGRAVLLQSKYVGKDYSGRWGNYFVHFLLSSDPLHDFETLLPIEAWKSPTWQAEATLVGEMPILKEIASGALNGASVSDVLADPGRAEQIAPFLTACETALARGRRVILVDDPTAVAAWIAIASFALPRRLALRLTFSSFATTPRDAAALITGTTEHCDLTSTELRNEFSLFDFHEGRFPEAKRLSPFAALATQGWMADGIERLARFSSFVDQVAPDAEPETLPSAWLAHALADGWDHLELEAKDFAWVRLHLCRYLSAQAERMAGALAAGAPPSEIAATITAAATLSDQAARGAIERHLVPRLLDLLCSIDTVMLAQLQTVLATPEGQDAARASIESWLVALESSTDPPRTAALLRFGSIYLAPLTTSTASRVACATFPHLATQYVAEALSECDTGSWLAFSEGLLESIALADDPIAIAAAVRWLRNHDTQDVAARVVELRRDIRLAARCAPLLYAGDRVKQLERCLDFARRVLGNVDAREIDACYEALFVGAAPTATAAAQILDFCRGTARGSSMARCFAQLAAHTRDDDERLQLAEALHRVEDSADTDAFLTMTRLRSPKIGRHAQIVDHALKLLESSDLSADAEAGLARAAAPAILHAAVEPSQDRTLARVVALPQLRTACEESLTRALTAPSASAARIAAGLIRASCSERPSGPLALWIGDVLRGPLAAWEKPEIARIREHFAFFAALGPSCGRFLAALRPGVLHRLRRRLSGEDGR